MGASSRATRETRHRHGAGQLASCAFAGGLAQDHRLFNKLFVLADPDVRHYRVLNDAVLADQESRTPHTDTERPVDVIHLDRHFVRIAKERKRQVVLIAEALVTVRVLRAYPGNRQADSLDIIMDIANRAGLFRAPGREVCRVEIQNQRAILQQIP